MTAEEKIQWYFEQKRFQRFDIPKKIIAQYLDLRPETFSRALKKIHP
jgi:CRP-like cAMP-binding protein